MSVPAPTPAPAPDSSSTARKVAVPIVSGACVVLIVAVLDHFGIKDGDTGPVQAAAVVVLTALADIFLPSRFLA